MKIGGTIYQMCEWIMRLAVINLLWIGFTLLGFGVLGFGPATAAMFAVERKWIMGETDIPIFKTFWDNYRKEFVSANKLGLILLATGGVLYADLQFALVLQGSWQSLFLSFTCIILLLFLLTLAYLFPVFAHFEFKTVNQYVKNAFLLGITQLPYTLLMLAGFLLLFAAFKLVPGLLPFFCVSSLSFVLTWSTHMAFARVERRKAVPEA